jgi:hypothetical protein
MQTPPDPTMGTTIASFVFLATTVTSVRTQFYLFHHHMNDALVQFSVTHIGFCITNRFASAVPTVNKTSWPARCVKLQRNCIWKMYVLQI